LAGSEIEPPWRVTEAPPCVTLLEELADPLSVTPDSPTTGTVAEPLFRFGAPVGTGTLTWLHSVVGVVVLDAEAAVLEMVYEKSKLPLSVVALRAERTWCSAGPFPRCGLWAGL
jgi:hypothetical protein